MTMTKFKVMRRRFDSLDAAVAYANLIFKRSGVVVAVEQVKR